MNKDIEARKKFVNSGNASLPVKKKLLMQYILSLILLGGICLVFYYFLANQLFDFVACLLASFIIIVMIVYFSHAITNEIHQRILLTGIWGLFFGVAFLLLGLLFMYETFKSPVVIILMGIIIAIIVFLLTIARLRNIFKGKYSDKKSKSTGYAYPIIGGAVGSFLGVTVLPRVFDVTGVSDSASLLFLTIIFLALATFMFIISIAVVTKIYYARKYGIEIIATDNETV